MALRRTTPGTATPGAAAPHVPRDRHHAARRTTGLEQLRPWDNLVTWFLVHLSGRTEIGYGHPFDEETQNLGDVFLTSSDGSWCEVNERPHNGTRQVWEAGPTPLRHAVENAHNLWHELGQPGWDRFGLTATSERQWVWLDSPDSDYIWPLRPRP